MFNWKAAFMATAVIIGTLAAVGLLAFLVIGLNLYFGPIAIPIFLLGIATYYIWYNLYDSFKEEK